MSTSAFCTRFLVCYFKLLQLILIAVSGLSDHDLLFTKHAEIDGNPDDNMLEHVRYLLATASLTWQVKKLEETLKTTTNDETAVPKGKQGASIRSLLL